MTTIAAENVSKLYETGEIGTGTLIRDFERWMAKKRKHCKSFDFLHRYDEPVSIWALKDINFTLEQGDIVGLKGPNGSGKSTLLKIIGNIIAPTTGKLTCHGRVVGLLESGSSFHSEFTGKENIFLQSAIYGSRRKEIRDRLDSIIAFSDLGAYLDTPVKRYSSGMLARLAFSILCHVHSEIIIVDETLAVGDLEFQNLCLNKLRLMGSEEGKTIILVSHTPGHLDSICNKNISLDCGKMI